LRKAGKMDVDIFDKILKETLKKLKYTSEENRWIMICFAGIPCSGKTTLAKRIEKKYKGVRINNDYIRKIIENLTLKNEEREKTLEEFLIDLLKKYPFRNHLVILDSGIERKFEEVKKVANLVGWEMFIIRMAIPKKEILERIRKKDPKRFMQYPEDIKRWSREYKEFNENNKNNFVFRSDSDLKRLYSKLDNIL